MTLVPDSTALRIAFLGLALSLLFSFLILPQIADSYNVNLDADGNGALGYNIYAGHGMKYSPAEPLALDRGPVYPYLVAALFSLAGGYSIGIIQVFQGVLHAATTLIVFVIGLKLYDRRIALRAQLLCAIHPILLWYTGRIWIESTHAFILALIALAVVSLYAQSTLRRALLTGWVLGLASLTKSVIVLFPFVLTFLLIRRDRQRGILFGLVIVGVTGLTIIPWTLRNYNVSGGFVPVHTSLGFNLIQGDVIGEGWPNQWCCNLDFWRLGQTRVDSVLGARGISSFRGVDGERALTEFVVQRYADDPLFLARRAVANFFMFWSLSESSLKSVVYGMLQWLLLFAAVFSYVRHGRINTLLTPIIVLALYYVVLHASIVGWARYSMPIIPLLILIAAPLMSPIKR